MILRPHVEPRHCLFCDAGIEFILMEDNDGSHGTRSVNNPVIEYKDSIGLHYYSNPTQSPDFNPIENVWRMLKQRVKKWKAESEAELRYAIQVEWDKITLEEINGYIASEPERMDQCVKRKRLNTAF